MGRKSIAQVRKKEIIKEFYEVARIEGLENASIAKIAKSMDINPSLIIHYFSNKQALIFGLIKFILQKYRGIFDVKGTEGLQHIDRLHLVMNRLFTREWNNLVDDGVYFSCFSLLFRDSEIKDSYWELHESLRGSLTDLITKCNEEETMKDPDPKGTADIIFVILEGAYFYLSMRNEASEYDDRLQAYKDKALNCLKPVTETNKNAIAVTLIDN